MSEVGIESVRAGAAVVAAVALVGCVPVVPQGIAVSPRPPLSQKVPALEEPAPASASTAPETAQPGCHDAEVAAISTEADALEAAIGAFTRERDVSPLVARIHALGEHPCFRLAPPVRFTERQTNSLGLTWFFAHGGREWLHQADAGRSREIVVPAPIPEAPAFQPISGWSRGGFVCGGSDTACGAETRAWSQRAERVINALGRRAPYSNLKACREGKGAQAYDAWVECRLARAGLEWVFPVGAVNAPKDGTLFSTASDRDCVELRVLDVATGAGVWAKACGSKPPAVSLGVVDARLLQEALFVSSMADSVISGPAFQRLLVPEEIPLSSQLDEFPEGVEHAALASSIQVDHTWAYVRRDQQLFQGKLTWPEDLNRPELTYAIWSFDAADATWLSGCSKRFDYKTLIAELARQAPRAGRAAESLRRALTTNQCATLPRPVRLGYREGWQSSGLSLDEPFQIEE